MVSPMMAGGVAGIGSMIKALMDGNSQYDDQQAKQQNLQKMIAARQTPAVAPLQAQSVMGQSPMMPSPAMAPPSATPSPMPSPPMAGMTQPMPVNPSSMGGATPLPGMPNGIDPSMQALFSQIPGGGGQ